MTTNERIARLERMLGDLMLALLRQGGDLDGAWGYPRTRDVLKAIAQELGRDTTQ
jgi:hypothetical protein